jgi:hypothetical protein
VDRARAEDERDAGRDQRADDRAHAGDAGARRRLVGALEHHQRELALADLGGRDEREAVPGRAEDEVERRVGAQRVDQRRGSGAERRRGKLVLQQRPAAVEGADLEGDRPGIDAGDARPVSRASAPGPDELLGDLVDAVDVQDGVVGLEQPPHAGLVHLHLRPADGQGAEHALAVVVLEVVGRLGALDPERLGRVEVGEHLDRVDLLPHRLGSSSIPAGPAARTSEAPVEQLGQLAVVLRLDDPQAALLGHGQPAGAAVLLAAEAVGRDARHRHVAALLLQQRGGAQADRAGAHDDGVRPFRSSSRASRATVVAAVVLQPLESSIADTRNGPKNASSTAASTSSPAPTLEPPTQTAMFARSFGPRVKNADCTSPFTTSGSMPRREQHVDVGVVGDDRVERARMLVGVELDQDLLHVSSPAARRVRCPVSRTRSRRGSANVM